ncbi:MAG: hypothetical protein K6G89_04910 [Clostridia bacterium]|nr:hypothetical protein [Clostridia bacterium]
MEEEKKEQLEDDGRVIANMNVDGMPWYAGDVPKQDGEAQDLKKLSKKQTLWLILGVAGAALLVAAVFALGFLLFILFADNVWFQH